MQHLDVIATKVFLIGTSSYSNEPALENLPSALDNVTKLKRLFIEKINVEEANIQVCIDSIDKIKLLKDLRNLCKKSKTDYLFLYYSGHGLTDLREEDLFLTLSNSTIEDLDIDCISIEELNNCLRNISKNVILIFDCCFSERAFDKIKQKNYFIIASSSRNETSKYRKDEPFSVFTKKLISALEYGIDNSKGEITLIDLYKDILASLVKDGFPSPRISQTNEIQDLIICVNPYQEKNSELPIKYLANKIYVEHGKRRTAYPTDMSFIELYKEKVYVSPKFYYINAKNHEIILFEDTLKKLQESDSLLALGAPGIGKSFFTFLTQSFFINNTESDKVCLLLDIRLLIQKKVIASFESLDLLYILETLADNYGIKEKINKLPQNYVFILDGVDELLGNVSHIDKLVKMTKKLKKFGNILMTCRKRDYEEILAKYFNNVFDIVYEMKSWEVNVEFTEFITKLESRKFLENKDFFIEVVKKSPALVELVQRPLHARMITFISYPVISEIKDLSHLYNEYLSKYTKTIDMLLISETCIEHSNSTYALWKDISWHIFTNDLFVHDKIKDNHIYELLVKKYKIQRRCVNRIISPLFNFVNVFNIPYLQYIHYSFFEYLVAEQMAFKMINCFHNRQDNISDFFLKDMKPEVRHHLMRIVNRIKPKGFAEWLPDVYTINKKYHKNINQQRVANNLLIYILGRLKENVIDELQKINDNEEDKFLRTSIFWALCSVGDFGSLLEYLEILENDSEMNKLNRGYLLYYYGDLDRTLTPPYYDNESSNWGNTRERTFNMINATNYEYVSPERKIIDIYTFLDFCLYRNEKLNKLEKNLFKKRLKEIKNNSPNPYPFEFLLNLLKLLSI